ncbi:hypothetical protein ACFVJ5_20160 [Nocardia sp. NPDC127606]|uniref:hypothetical protein n=1 Tax=Nocardia sp. NPDC127606 TaxID=3345406 RepID=UPI0036371710
MTTAAELKALQAPVKQRYRDDPAAAVTALRGTASFADPGITCTVRTFAGPVRAGLHRATGGDGADACSGDMLLEAVAACAGVTCRASPPRWACRSSAPTSRRQLPSTPPARWASIGPRRSGFHRSP